MFMTESVWKHRVICTIYLLIAVIMLCLGIFRDEAYDYMTNAVEVSATVEKIQGDDAYVSFKYNGKEYKDVFCDGLAESYYCDIDERTVLSLKINEEKPMQYIKPPKDMLSNTAANGTFLVWAVLGLVCFFTGSGIVVVHGTVGGTVTPRAYANYIKRINLRSIVVLFSGICFLIFFDRKMESLILFVAFCMMGVNLYNLGSAFGAEEYIFICEYTVVDKIITKEEYEDSDDGKRILTYRCLVTDKGTFEVSHGPSLFYRKVEINDKVLLVRFRGYKKFFRIKQTKYTDDELTFYNEIKKKTDVLPTDYDVTGTHEPPKKRKNSIYSKIYLVVGMAATFFVFNSLYATCTHSEMIEIITERPTYSTAGEKKLECAECHMEKFEDREMLPAYKNFFKIKLMDEKSDSEKYMTISRLKDEIGTEVYGFGSTTKVYESEFTFEITNISDESIKHLSGIVYLQRPAAYRNGEMMTFAVVPIYLDSELKSGEVRELTLRGFSDDMEYRNGKSVLADIVDIRMEN